MIRILAVLAFAVSAASAESFEAMHASAALPTPTPIKFARAQTNGRIAGGLRGEPFEINIDRRAGRISGALELRTFALEARGDGDSFTGGAFGQGLDAKFTTEQDGSFTVEGHVRGWGFKYNVSDADHKAKGSLGGRDFEISYDLEAGTAKGGAGGWPFELNVDKVTGKTTGAIDGQTAGFTLQNADLGWVLLHLFLFVK